MTNGEPIWMILHCPKCTTQHIDKGKWATTRTHKTHLCEKCGHLFKPAMCATVGVRDFSVAPESYERVVPPNLGCKLPPPGWWCSREPGHDGPCAARSIR